MSDAADSRRGTARRSARRPWPAGWLPVIVGLVASTFALVAGLYRLYGLEGAVRLAVVAAGVAGLAWSVHRLARQIVGPEPDIGTWASVIWLALLGAGAALANVLPLAESRRPARSLNVPILLRPNLLSGHPLGTDRNGLDLLGGVLFGARVSIVVGIGAVAIGLVVGMPIGMAAGYYRGKLEVLVDFAVNVMLAFPPIILLLAMASVLHPDITNVTLSLGIISVPIYIRIAKVNTMLYAQRDFVLAAVVAGARKRRILVRELLPCVLPSMLAYGVVVVALAIVAEASLSFLGLSIPRPEPTWGNMIAAGQDSYTKNPHLVFVPATFLVVTVLCLNRVAQVSRSGASARSGVL